MFSLRSSASVLRSPGFRQLRYNSTNNAAPVSADLNLKVLTAANSGHFQNAFHYASEVKASRGEPNISVYNALMSLAAREKQWLFSWAIFDDMLHANVKPTQATYAHLIQAQRSRNYTNVWSAISHLNESGLTPNSAIATAILENMVGRGNLETALQYLLNMKRQNITPELPVVQAIVVLASKCGYSRLALELATLFEKDTMRRMDESVWLACLASSAENHDLRGVVAGWSKVVDELQILPDEGTAMAVLHTAARHGLPDLSTDVLRILKLIGVSWQEFHFAALIEAFCKNGQLKEALITLDIMRSNGVEPLRTTANSILESLTKGVDVVDSAWSILDEIHSSGSGLGIDAMNVVIQASVDIGDLQRAIGLYKALPDYGIKPDIPLFNILLEGCVAAQHRQLGDVLLEDIKQAGLQPDVHVFEQIIRLCLTQEVYEDAFFYLEEMKSARFVPSQQVYQALVDKCSDKRDPRLEMVLAEMKECGYTKRNKPTKKII